jgi:hypothetical protein
MEKRKKNMSNIFEIMAARYDTAMTLRDAALFMKAGLPILGLWLKRCYNVQMFRLLSPENI